MLGEKQNQMSRVLTAQLVEELHQACIARRNIEPIVASISSSTLPGLMEYCVVRWSGVSLPELPVNVLQSSLAQKVLRIKSPIGLRSSGHSCEPLMSVAAQECEFISLDRKRYEEEHRSLFLVRLRQAATDAGFASKRALAIAGAIGEMIDNAIFHSESEPEILVGYQVKGNAICCCICDVGIGVLASLRTNPIYSNLTRHKDAIRKSLETGVSRMPSGGTGFMTLFRALANLWGTLRFRSGEGCVTMDGTSFDSARGTATVVLNRPGFQVTICCRSDDDLSAGVMV